MRWFSLCFYLEHKCLRQENVKERVQALEGSPFGCPGVPSGAQEYVSRGHILFKNNYWRDEGGRERSGGSRRPPNQLSDNIPLGQATYPQLPTPRPTGPWEDARELLPHCSCTKEIEHF